MAKKKSDEQEQKMIRITQVRGTPGVKHAHREVLRSLGLRRPRHTVERVDTPAVRGMVKKVEYLVKVEGETS